VAAVTHRHKLLQYVKNFGDAHSDFICKVSATDAWILEKYGLDRLTTAQLEEIVRRNKDALYHIPAERRTDKMLDGIALTGRCADCLELWDQFQTTLPVTVAHWKKFDPAGFKSGMYTSKDVEGSTSLSPYHLYPYDNEYMKNTMMVNPAVCHRMQRLSAEPRLVPPVYPELVQYQNESDRDGLFELTQETFTKVKPNFTADDLVRCIFAVYDTQNVVMVGGSYVLSQLTQRMQLNVPLLAPVEPNDIDLFVVGTCHSYWDALVRKLHRRIGGKLSYLNSRHARITLPAELTIKYIDIVRLQHIRELVDRNDLTVTRAIMAVACPEFGVYSPSTTIAVDDIRNFDGTPLTIYADSRDLEDIKNGTIGVRLKEYVQSDSDANTTEPSVGEKQWHKTLARIEKYKKYFPKVEFRELIENGKIGNY